jgi:hypothetical protein
MEAAHARPVLNTAAMRSIWLITGLGASVGSGGCRPIMASNFRMRWCSDSERSTMSSRPCGQLLGARQRIAAANIGQADAVLFLQHLILLHLARTHRALEEQPGGKLHQPVVRRMLSVA